MGEVYGIIYKATHIKSGKVYIGQTTKTLEHRRKQHIKNMYRRHGKFQCALRKYGEDAFTWDIIDTATEKDELDEKEKYWIAFYDSINTGYNMTEGGDGTSGVKHNEETRRKLSESTKRLWQDEEYRYKLTKAFTGESNPFYGKTHTEEIKKKISEANKGVKNPKAKITELQVLFIRAISLLIKTSQNREADLTQTEVCEWLNVSPKQIRSILTGRQWKHLPTFEEIRAIWRELYEQEYGNKENKNVSDDNKSGVSTDSHNGAA